MSAVLPTAPLAPVAVPSFDVHQQAQASRYGVLVGAQRLLLATDGAVRVLEPPPVYRLPNTHRWFHGITNVRGTLVPVYDLAGWLDLTVPDAGRMLLVVGEDEVCAGVLVDSSPRHLLVPTAASSSPAPVLPDRLADYGDGAFEVAGETWTAVDWTTLFIQLRTLALVAE